MKKLLFKASLAVALLFGSNQAEAQTAGTLTFTFTTIAHTGYQGTKNALAVWIQTNTGTFVKTFYRYAGSGGGTQDHLPTFAVNAGGTSTNCLSASCNVVGATTGATLAGAVTKTVTWDGKNTSGVLMADGTYKITIQETWNHGTSGTTTSSFTFTKGPNQDVQTPTADGNFTNMSLQWIPAAAPVPTASFTASANTVCAGQTVQLTSTSTGSPTSYQWTMTGGTPATSTTQNPTVSYATAGSYQVSLVATNATGSSTPSTQTIVVNAAPTVSATTPGSRCGTGTVSLSATASTGTIVWYDAATGGTALGTGSTFTTPSISTTTTYYAEALSNSCASTRTAVTATVTAGPTITATTPASRCGAGTVTLSATGSAGTLSWFSAPTGGTALGTGNTFTTPTISATTNYYVEANTGSCPSARSTVVATINPTPTVTNPGNATGCANSPTTAINFAGTNGATFDWVNDNTAIGLAASGSGNIASFTAATAGTSNIIVTPSLNGCTGAPVTFTLTINPLPNVTLAAFNNVCVSDPSFALTGGLPAGGTYSGTGVTGNNFSPSAAGAGTFNILYYVNQNGCTNTATSTMTVDACAGVDAKDLVNVSIFPNPTSGIIYIQGDDVQQFNKATVFDMSGRNVGEFALNGNTTLDLNNLPIGQYKLKLTGNTIEKTVSIQIKK